MTSEGYVIVIIMCSYIYAVLSVVAHICELARAWYA